MPQRGQQQMMPANNPAVFNRMARLHRHRCGSLPYKSGVLTNLLDLPNVGYHYRLGVYADLDHGTTAGSGLTARFLSGHFGGNTSRFPAPLGLVNKINYTLNVSTPIYASDGYGNFLLQLVNNRGSNPWTQVASGDVGRNRKERTLFCLLNATTGAFAKPDDALAVSTNYKSRFWQHIPLTLGEAATAGLVPVQDARINPQIDLGFGTAADLVSVAADLPAITGNFDVYCDYFTTPSEAIRPDTDFILQTRMDQQTIAGTGEQIYKPQIGGVILRVIQSIWNNGKAVDPSTITRQVLRVQQGLILEDIAPVVRIADEHRWYSKKIPDEVYVWDHVTGMGDPTLPSLRDRIASNQLTRLEYVSEIASGTSITQPAELRNYMQQLVPLPRAQ
jgi:hypothetical protein